MDHRAFVRALFDVSPGDRGRGFVELDAAGWEAAHGVARSLEAEALLAARLRGWGALERAPAHVVSAIDHAYKNNVVHALGASRELDQLVDLFASSGIDVAPLKGAALMRRGVHRDLGGRYMHDLDLLVRKEDRARIRALLDQRGYAEAPDGESPKHLPPLRRGRVYVELHEFAYWEASGARVDLDAWRSASRAGDTELARVVVHLVHHLFRSSVNEPLLALKTAWDLHELGAVVEDWNLVAQRAAEAGLARELAILRSLSDPHAERADVEAGLDLCRPLDERDLTRRVLAFHARVLTRAPLWYRALHLRALLAPSARAMAKIHGGELRGAALAKAYVSRPVVLANKGLRAAWASLRRR